MYTCSVLTVFGAFAFKYTSSASFRPYSQLKFSSFLQVEVILNCMIQILAVHIILFVCGDERLLDCIQIDTLWYRYYRWSRFIFIIWFLSDHLNRRRSNKARKRKKNTSHGLVTDVPSRIHDDEMSGKIVLSTMFDERQLTKRHCLAFIQKSPWHHRSMLIKCLA